MTYDDADDRRVRRTRMAVFEAFRALVLSRRYDEIRVADIIERADVGRSTFYDHFQSKDDVLLNSIEPLFAILANAASGKAERDDLSFVLSHFWEQRALARIIFGPALFFKLARKLTEMIEARLDGRPQARMIATERATAMLGVIRSWLAGEFACDADKLAEYIAGNR